MLEENETRDEHRQGLHPRYLFYVFLLLEGSECASLPDAAPSRPPTLCRRRDQHDSATMATTFEHNL